MHNDLENNYNAFLDASIKMKELYSAEEKEAEILKYAMRTSHSFRDWDAIEKMHKDAESVLDGSTCNSAYLPKNLRNLIERAMEGQWTQEMTDIVQKATTYLGHADNNDTPEMTEATIAASEIIRKAIAFSHDNDNYCSKEFETARTRINGAYFSELKLTIDAFLEGEKDLYVKAREAGIDKEFCVRNLICLDASNVDKWEHEFENAAKEDITYE